MLRITGVSRGSPASRAGLRPGDRLIECNGIQIDDWMDLMLAASSPGLQMSYSRGGLVRKASISRRSTVPLGLDVEGSGAAPCSNSCIFCFMDQMPPGVRASLLCRDDDVRHSFVYGNFVTLDREQAEYAAKKRLSPIHVSVHAADPVLRGRMLGLGRPSPILPQLDMLSREGISVEAQIVVVPGFNDGPALEETLDALLEKTCVEATGVVPVGLTRYRDGLTPLRRPDASESASCLEACSRVSCRAFAARGVRWAYPADEFFILAGRDIPDPSFYEGCCMKANGIGMLADLLQNRRRSFEGGGTIVTGSLAAPFLGRILEGSAYSVLEVRNSFFGEMVGVAGLLTAGDVLDALRASGGADPVYLPGSMFSRAGLTIDGVRAEDAERMSGRRIVVADALDELG